MVTLLWKSILGCANLDLFSLVNTQVEFYADKGVAILTVSDKGDFSKLQEINNITIEGKELSLVAANLVWDITDVSLETYLHERSES